MKLAPKLALISISIVLNIIAVIALGTSLDITGLLGLSDLGLSGSAIPAATQTQSLLMASHVTSQDTLSQIVALILATASITLAFRTWSLAFSKK
jgi:hypothetical protein